ncbi:GNAT family N-acetyltransferase [Sanguibacter sp. A247]|uniref:GNAT family N-acetyltransferase n=1 Tax=unclassified Sanguibacter TaxID=2645534 RepID=UPI003FD8F6B0
MGRWFRGQSVAHSTGVRALTDADVPRALALCALDPVASVLAASRLRLAASGGLAVTGSQGWVYPASGEPRALCWVGANVVPVLGECVGAEAEAALDAFAVELRRGGRRASSIVGPAPYALGLWDRLGATWGPAREVRPVQPSLAIDRLPDVDPDPEVRLASPAELAVLLPASVAMFLEEVGYSPLGAAPGAYIERVRSLAQQGRTFVRTAPGARVDAQEARLGLEAFATLPAREHVVFKAELGAIAGPIAQVQGVWVTPTRRGAGIAAPAMAAVVVGALERHPVISLYVNDFNERAVATYRRVGFEQVGTFATILF